MSKIIVLGGGVIGLSTAMMLARDGADVTVLERDIGAVPDSPDEAWHTWQRLGVAQFRQPHFLLPAGYHILEAQLPEVCDNLLQAGGVTFDMLSLMPPSIADRAAREGDERFVTVTARRPAIEWAVAKAAERCVRVVRGVSVNGLLTGAPASNGVPRVAGVRTTDGERLDADLVVDATGRRSKLPDWLAAIDARRPVEEAEESAFMYYTRFFRASSGKIPAYQTGLLTHFQSFSILALPGDAGTWSVTVFIFSGDPALKALKDADRWTALVETCPAHAHWLEGDALTDVLPMAGVTDRYRCFVVDGMPAATGVVSVGDSWACTNPVGGRGISIGLMHAAGTAEVVRKQIDDPLALALAHDEMTETRVTPWYRHTVAFDSQRTAQIRGAIEGRGPEETHDLGSDLAAAMAHDAELFRASVAIQSLLDFPGDVLSRPGMAERIRVMARAHQPVAPPGPSREDVLRLMTA